MRATVTTIGATLAVVLGLLGLGTGCPSAGGYSSDDDEGADYWGDDDWGDDDAADDDAGDDDMGDDDTSADDDTGPPEDENDFISVPPSASDVFVFIANPTRDTVSKVHVVTRQIDSIPVGDEPRMVLVTEDYGRAVVFNDGDDTVSVIDVDAGQVDSVEVREDFNFMVMSPSGEHVICFLNTALLDAGEVDQVDGVLSYTEVSIVDLDGLVSHDFSVGFNPKQIQFADGGDRAVIIADQFLTVVELTEDPPTPVLIDLESDPFHPPTAKEVEVEPTGEFAYIRYENENAIQVVDLDTGELLWVPVGSDPTDLDLSPDGTEVMVVSRTSQELRIFEATDPELPPEVLDLPPTETIGSLAMAPEGNAAILFTTASLTDRVTTWNRATDEMVIHRLEKPVEQVIMAPDGDSALIVHTLEDSPGENDVYTPEELITVITIGGGQFIPNAVLLEDELMAVSNFDDGVKAVFMMDENRNVGIVDYPSRLVDDVMVPSYPVHVGVMPEGPALPVPVAWVSQDHPLGRISFLDPETLAVQTVTGFELNSEIE